MPDNCTGLQEWPECQPSNAGVDWLTATAKPGHRAEELYDWGSALVDAEATAGYERRPWAWNRYQGWTGGQVAVGERQDGAIVRLSGQAAQAHYPGAVRLAGNVSRCDLAVNVVGMQPGLDLAGLSLARVKEEPSRRGRPSEWSYIRTRSHGATLYLGSRQSSRYCRLYDKSAERDQQHLAGDWRYEVEYKGDLACQVARQLVGERHASHSVSATVWKEFSDHGVPPVYQYSSTPLDVREKRTPTDDERRLAWLRGQVSLTVARLVAKGRRAEVLEALGLDCDPGDHVR